jgi:hypothetical protein
MAAEAFRRNADISSESAQDSDDTNSLVRLQEQMSGASLSEIRNPFHRLTRITMAAMPIVFNYLRNNELFYCALLNRELYKSANALIWGKLDFSSPSYARLRMLEKFLSSLPMLSQFTLELIHEIDMASIDESIYNTVPEDWLSLIVRYCSELRVLIVSKARFLSPASVRKLHPYAALTKVHTLDLSYCDHLNEMVLKRIADLFPNLHTLKLAHISGLSDSALSELVYTCHNLSSLNISYARSLSNASLYSVAKFCTIRLRELDLSNNERISDEGLAILAKYNAHLTHLNLTKMSKITDKGINSIIKTTARHLKHLQLHDCKNLKDPLHTMRRIAERCQVLESLTISWDMIKDDVTVLKGFQSPLTELTIRCLPEHTPIRVLERIVQFFYGRPLRTITFTRNSYSSDFLYGSYTEVKATEYTEITADEVTKFNLRGESHIIALLVNERETDTSYEMHNW